MTHTRATLRRIHTHIHTHSHTPTNVPTHKHTHTQTQMHTQVGGADPRGLVDSPSSDRASESDSMRKGAVHATSTNSKISPSGTVARTTGAEGSVTGSHSDSRSGVVTNAPATMPSNTATQKGIPGYLDSGGLSSGVAMITDAALPKSASRQGGRGEGQGRRVNDVAARKIRRLEAQLAHEQV